VRRAPLSPHFVSIATTLLILSATFAAAQQSVVLHTFGKTTGDGISPWSALVSDKSGNLYGTTTAGGAFNHGTVFELIKPTTGPWTEEVLYSFGANSNDGTFPQAGVIFDDKGNLYGTNFGGSSDGSNTGTIFELSPPTSSGEPWTETLLYEFPNTHGNYGSPAGLVFGPHGVLYGVTTYGGNGDGSACELHPPTSPGGTWTEKTFFEFNVANGQEPEYQGGGLTVDSSGNLYGTAPFGGLYGSGVAYEFSPPVAGGPWTQTILYSFGSNPLDAFGPLCKVVFDSAGNMYGTSSVGGAYGYGTVWELSPPTTTGAPWTETILDSLTGTNGLNSRAGVVFDKAGNLYGTTFGGGTGNPEDGIVFELSPPAGSGDPWTETVLENFTNGAGGGQLYSGVLVNAQGTIYGTTSVGGLRNCGPDSDGCGVAFEIKP
jgi:uncharacterized repeat protein (TIGR03803 family)